MADPECPAWANWPMVAPQRLAIGIGKGCLNTNSDCESTPILDVLSKLP